MEKVLFSCVGNTDPMNQKNLYDGPLLHIIRHYQPEKVYLYMSAVMKKKHLEENLYEPYIKDLAHRLNYEIDIEYIDSQVEKVYKFDILLKEYKPIIERIHRNHPEANILLNTSSGTPAMKSAIAVLSAGMSYPNTVIQVTTPQVGTHDTPEDGTDWQTLWECNLDNEQASNRCEEVENINLKYEIQKNAIEKLINQYDYAATYDLALDIKDLMNKQALELILAQKHRKNLDWAAVEKTLHLVKAKDLITLKEGKETFEYFLKWQSDLEVGDYRSFIVGLSPLFTELMKEVISHYYPRQTWTKDMNWNTQRFIPEVQAAVEKVLAFSSGAGKIFNADLTNLVRYLDLIPEDVKELVKKIREAEKSARNMYAHQIIAISQKELEKKTKMPLDHLVNCLWKVFTKIHAISDQGANTLKNAYKEVNQSILALL